MEIEKTAINRIIECHNGIHGSMKQALDYAFEAGKLLTETKDELEHGEFLPWIKECMPFSKQTAWNYMKLFEHRQKLLTVSNFAEAYKRIETIEKQEKQTENQRANNRVKEYRKTGAKPEGWREHTDDKLANEEKARDERIEKVKEEMRQAKIKRETKEKEKVEHNDYIDDLLKQAQAQLEIMDKHSHLDLSNYIDTSNQQIMFTAIELYLNSFDGVSSQMEAAHNLIKKLKMVVTELQKQSIQ